VFESALGFNQSNADDLLKQIQVGVANHPPTSGTEDKFGSRFTVDIPVVGPSGRGVVRTGWIFKGASDIPELTTLFVR
jgi:filamentous hemagglutinin